MINCEFCANADMCKYIVAPNDCEDFEETFEYLWETMDDIEREEYFGVVESEEE